MSAEQIKNGFVLAAIAVQTNKNAKNSHFYWFRHFLMRTQIAISERNRNPKCKVLQDNESKALHFGNT